MAAPPTERKAAEERKERPPLRSRPPGRTVSWALGGLTTVFGMGNGVSPPFAGVPDSQIRESAPLAAAEPPQKPGQRCTAREAETPDDAVAV